MGLILLALTLLFPFLYKYSFVITNQFSQIPIILSFMDAKYLSHDWYVLANRAFGPRTIFAWYMAQTAKIFTLPVTFFLHYLLYIFLIIYSSYKLSFFIFKNKFIALATTISILFGTSITLGGNMLVTADLSAPQLPLGLTLLGVVLLIEKKYLVSSILFAIASFSHPLIGFEATVLFFSALILTYLLLKQPIAPFFNKAIIPYSLLASPAFFLYLREFSNKTVPNIDKLNILAYMRNPYHFVASTFLLSSFFQFFSFLLLFCIFLLYLKKYVNPVLFTTIVFSSLLILFSCLLGYISTEIIKFYPFVVLQPFRLTLYLYWLEAIIILGGSLFLTIKYKLKYSSLFLIPLFISNIQILQPVGKMQWLAIMLAIFLIIFFNKISKKIFIFFLLLYFSLLRFHQNFNFSSYINYPTDEVKVAIWVKNNTPINANFLVPPDFESFRLVADREIIADWKAFPFQEKAMLEWAQRMCEIGNLTTRQYKNITKDKIISGYRSLDTNTILLLAQKYNYQYIITDIYYPSLKPIYKNHFYVYNLVN